MAAITPEAFQASVMAWIGVLTVVAGALSGFIALIISYYNKIKAAAAADKADVANARLDHQSDKLDRLRSDVTNVALSVPPAAPTEPAKVEVVNQSSNPVPVEEK